MSAAPSTTSDTPESTPAVIEETSTPEVAPDTAEGTDGNEG